MATNNSSASHNGLLDKFPHERKVKLNPATTLYGRRFYKDQTPVEYLAEFLLVFASPKGRSQADENSFSLQEGDDMSYWPEDRVALKLFSFFPTSILGTRHPAHHREYLNSLRLIEESVDAAEKEKNDVLRLLQSFFSGFVGVAGNRTWVAHSFLPVSSRLLARELNWAHSKAVKKLKDDSSWDDAKVHFQANRYMFMAKGGELLFLQLAHLFLKKDNWDFKKDFFGGGYSHLEKTSLQKLQKEIETNLIDMLNAASADINKLASYIESLLSHLNSSKEKEKTNLGSVPRSTVTESFLFASEFNNICISSLGALEKFNMLQILCCVQVLRSLCFQAQRFDSVLGSIDGFIGNYAWIVSNPQALPGSGVRKLSQSSLESIEELLFRVLRKVARVTDNSDKLAEADKSGFQLFRKLSKELGLVIPRTGKGQRFALPPALLHFFVAALVKPGERVRLTEFYSRLFLHYGIAIGGQELMKAVAWMNNEPELNQYSMTPDTAWVEDALQQGGFLMELSDAVSIVMNPNARG